MLLSHSDCNAITDQGDTLLLLAIKKNHNDLVSLLLTLKLCDINHADEHGNTALHCAAETGNAAVIRQLLKHGAEVAARNVTGETPIQLAANRAHGTVVKHLLKHDKKLAKEILDQHSADNINGETKNQTNMQEKSINVLDCALDRVSDADVIKFVLHHLEDKTRL